MDVGDRERMRSRPWSWFLALVEGCLTARSRLLWERVSDQDRRTVIEAFGQGADVTPWL